jgi:hypothetical protein
MKVLDEEVRDPAEPIGLLSRQAVLGVGNHEEVEILIRSSPHIVS